MKKLELSDDLYAALERLAAARHLTPAELIATLVNPPALSITSTSASSDVAGGSQFTFTATARNTGDLRAPSPAFTLTLPSGFSCTPHGT